MAIFYDLNWLGLLIGAALSYALGMLWFSPRGFGKIHLAALGKTAACPPSQAARMALPLLLQALYTLLLAVFIAALFAVGFDMFCFAVILLAVLHFLGVLCGALWDRQNIRVPLIAGGYGVAMIFIIAITIHLTAIYF